MVVEFAVGEEPPASKLDALPKGVIARHRRTSNKTGITTEIGVLRLDDVPLSGGRKYTVRLDSMRLSAVAAMVTARFRYTADGSTPGTGSTSLSAFIHPNTTSADSFAMSRGYIPAADETFSVLLTLQSTASIATANADADSPIEVVIIDEGVDPGDTGVDV